VRDRVKPEIEWWRAAGREEREACDTDAETLCLARCQPAAEVIAPPQASAETRSAIGVRSTLVIGPPLATESSGGSDIYSTLIPADPGAVRPASADSSSGAISMIQYLDLSSITKSQQAQAGVTLSVTPLTAPIELPQEPVAGSVVEVLIDSAD